MTFGSRAHSARRHRAILLAASLAAGIGQIVRAQDEPPVRRPNSANRLVRLFDFEELENPYEVPKNWSRAQDGEGSPRPGYPGFNKARFDKAIASSGKTSVVLPTQGGSTVLRLNPGALPVFPDADYTVSAKVLTQDLQHARAFLTARLLDQNLAPIAGSEQRSAPILSPGVWQTVQIGITGKWPGAAWLQIDLELLQPKQFQPAPPPALRPFAVNHEDVSGGAYFDDVAVALQPRTRFWAAKASGVFVAPEAPSLNMLARDQGGEELVAKVRVEDVDGRTVARQSFKLDPSARAAAWTPTLPGFGWYRAVMDIDTADINVTRQEIWFCSLPERMKLADSPARSADLRRFGLICDTTPEAQLGAVPALVESIGTRFLTIPAFDASVPVEQAKDALAARSAVLERLIAQGQQITLVLGEVPPELTASEVLDSTDALGMVELDSKRWMPFVEPTLDVYGQQILRYQVGKTGDTHAMRRDGSRGLTGFERTISRLVPGPRIALPWRADHALPLMARTTDAPTGGADAPLSTVAPGPLVDDLVVEYPLGFAPGAMQELALSWREHVAGGHPLGLTVVPELPPMEKYGARARAVEMARRAAEFWSAMGGGAESRDKTAGTLVARLAVSSPWRPMADRSDAAGGAGGAEATLMPGPAVAVIAEMAERLSGRRVVAAIPAPAGVRAMLLAEQAGARPGADSGGRPGETLVRACVLAWNEGADPEHAWVDVYPAREGVDVVDMFGNATRLSPGSGTTGGSTGAGGAQIRVPLGDAPVFIEGVDPYLAQFTSSFHLTPSFVPAMATEHEMRIGMTNPWPIRITGQIQIKEAEAPATALKSGPWKISPNVVEFAIAPGQTASLPVTLSFGAGQLAGVKDLVMVARVLADRQYPPIRTTTTVEVGLPDLDLIPEAQLGPTPQGPDVIVTAAVTNRDARPRTLKLELSAKDTPSQQYPISDLPPSQTVYRRFVIRDGAKGLGGKHVRVTLVDDESAARLSKAALVPEAP